MRRQTAKSSVRATPDEPSRSASPIPRQERANSPQAPEALLAFAEELGRLLARRLLADPDRRDGYGLPEGMGGLVFNATMMVLAYLLLAWLRG